MIQNRFVIIDTETTGLSANTNHIIEIALVVVEKGRIVDRYTSLVDPGVAIPSGITAITGITSQMVFRAPRFFQIHEKIFDYLRDSILVAHNAPFDTAFMRSEFGRCGKIYAPPTLCTVQLSRKLFPMVIGHKLEDIIYRFKIPYKSRHRAEDDALVLWYFLDHVRTRFGDEKLAAVMRGLIR